MLANYKKLRSKAIVTVLDAQISGLQLEISLKRIWGRHWDWIASPLSSSEFLVSFLSIDELDSRTKEGHFRMDGFSFTVT